MPDTRVSIYSPDGQTLYAEDASSDIGRGQLTYSDSPDGSNAAAKIPLILRYEDVFERGYWREWNIVELSSGDNLLVANAASLSAGSTQKYYLDTNWGFDPRVWADDQIAYFWDGTNLTMRCPVLFLGFDNAPSVMHQATTSAVGSSATRSITAATAGNQLLAIVTTGVGIAASISGWTSLGFQENGVRLTALRKTAAGGESSVVVSAGSSTTIRVTVMEIANTTSALTATFDAAAQTGPVLSSPPVSASAVGSLVLAAFGIGAAAGPYAPRGWIQQSSTPAATTTLSQTISALGTVQTVNVGSSTGFVVGSLAAIGLGTATFETVTITGVGSGNISAVFQKAHAINDPVSSPIAATNALAVYSAQMTDLQPASAVTSFAAATTLAGIGLSIVCPVAGGLTPQPWIICGTSANGGGTPAYGVNTIVGRRRYSGVIQRRERVNQKTPDATITCTGLAEYFNRKSGSFTFSDSQAIDIGTVLFDSLELFTTPSTGSPLGDIPMLNIDASNFPQIGQTYSNTYTNVMVGNVLSDVLKAISSGDGWFVRVGHDRTPRLLRFFQDSTNLYQINVPVGQGDPSKPYAFAVAVTDCDVTQMKSRQLVTGDNDPVTGQAVSAIVEDQTSFAYYGVWFDGATVQVQGLKTIQECANYAKAQLDQYSIAASQNQLMVYTRANPQANMVLPGGMLQGDVLPPIANITATDFQPATVGGAYPPDISGLASVIQTTLECDANNGTDSYQNATFAGMMPDWRDAIAEKGNAIGNAFKNTNAPAGIDQYMIDQTAYPPTFSGFTVTVPGFPAVFAAGSLPIGCGANSFTVAPKSVTTVWLHANNTYTLLTQAAILAGASPIVAGAIPYGLVQSNGSGITGFRPLAQIALLKILAPYLYEGALLTPTVTGPTGSGSPALSISGPGLLTSQITVQFQITNQPTDGSFVKVECYYRQNGQPNWIVLATSPPRNTTALSDGNGTQLTGAATAAAGLYEFVCPEAANGKLFEFGVAVESNRGTETSVVLLGSIERQLGIPSGATLTITAAPTYTNKYTGPGAPPATLTEKISIPFTIAGGVSDVTWLDHINVLSGFYDPSDPSPGSVIFTQPGNNGGALSGTIVFTTTFVQNATYLGNSYAYTIFLQMVAPDGSVVASNSYTFLHT